MENIEVVESYVESLLDELEGKTVITANHGENLGETQFGLTRVSHGHETEECRYVPWLESPYDERKTIESEKPRGFNYSDQRAMSDRLEALGYI